jgi:hypothetical protein
MGMDMGMAGLSGAEDKDITNAGLRGYNACYTYRGLKNFHERAVTGIIWHIWKQFCDGNQSWCRQVKS